MKIYLREDKLMLIKESEEDVTFFKFFTEVKNFIRDLLDDPIEAKPSGFFKTHGISRSLLLNKMLDKDIINKKENIDEPNDADGNKKSMHYIQYKVPKKNFEKKIKRLYSYFFENEKRKKIDEAVNGWGSFSNTPYQEYVKPQKYDSVAVYIFCKDESGKLCVLAGKRRGYGFSGCYNVPTGMIGDHYYGETPEEAAVREVSEESGVMVDTSQLRDLGDEQYTDSHLHLRLGKNYIVTFDGTTKEHMPGAGDGENDRFQWIPVEQINLLAWAFGQDKNIYNIANTL